MEIASLAISPFTQPVVAQLTTKSKFDKSSITLFSTAQLGAIDQSKELSIPQSAIAQLQLIAPLGALLPLCKT